MKKRLVLVLLAIVITATPISARCASVDPAVIVVSQEMDQDEVERFKAVNDEIQSSVMAGGTAIGNFQTSIKIVAEENFTYPSGFGWAAEKANTTIDRILGRAASVIGDDNIKNGADRVIKDKLGNAIMIQSKYYATGKNCVDACFDMNGQFRYYDSFGNPMIIEVPADENIYNEAVRVMQGKIAAGKVPGVTDPEKASSIVRKGNITYRQAVNVAKAGTLESLTYDAAHGAVISASTFGVSAAVSFACSMWNGESYDVAIRKSVSDGLKVGGTTFAVSVAASQLARAGLNSALVPGTEALTNAMGPKVSAAIINAYRAGGNSIWGAAAMKSTAKLLRANTIACSVTTAVVTLPDVVNLFRGRISGSQLVKNLSGNTAAIVGGHFGYIGGAAIGNILFPGVGAIVGGIIGATGTGGLLGFGANKVADCILEDDADKMIEIIQEEFQKLSCDYLVNQQEAEELVKALSSRLTGKVLKEMYASKDRYEFARELMIPLFEQQAASRSHVDIPEEDDMTAALEYVLEEAYE